MNVGEQVKVVERNEDSPSLLLLYCGLLMSVKENPDRK